MKKKKKKIGLWGGGPKFEKRMATPFLNHLSSLQVRSKTEFLSYHILYNSRSSTCHRGEWVSQKFQILRRQRINLISYKIILWFLFNASPRSLSPPSLYIKKYFITSIFISLKKCYNSTPFRICLFFQVCFVDVWYWLKLCPFIRPNLKVVLPG